MPQPTESGKDLISNIRVLIVDDHSLFAEGLRSALEDHGITTVAIASTGAQAIAAARKNRPNLVLLDLNLPDMDGFVVAQRLLEQQGDLKILALTALDDSRAAQEAIRAGFRGYLPKHAGVTDLVSAIIAATRSQAVLPHDLAQALFGGERQGKAARSSPRGPEKQLTNREREILALLATGATGPEIAATLYLSPNTVRTHVQNILAKLGVHSRLEAVAVATRLGLARRPKGT
jgi:DNA-binding NarL/FixJ family response regulator